MRKRRHAHLKSVSVRERAREREREKRKKREIFINADVYKLCFYVSNELKRNLESIIWFVPFGLQKFGSLIICLFSGWDFESVIFKKKYI